MDSKCNTYILTPEEIKAIEQRAEYAEAQAMELTAENRSLYEQIGRMESRRMSGGAISVKPSCPRPPK